MRGVKRINLGDDSAKMTNGCAIAVVRNNVEAKNLPEEVSDEDIALIVRITTRGGLELMMDSLVPRVSTMGSGERHQFYAESLNRCIITNIGATEVIDTLQKAQAESASIP